MNTPAEVRSPNGDLWITHNTDPIVQARTNLRYWEDRAMRGLALKPAEYLKVDVDRLLNAVRYMIETIDAEYQPGRIANDVVAQAATDE